MRKDVLRTLKIFLFVEREANWRRNKLSNEIELRRNIYSIIFDNSSFSQHFYCHTEITCFAEDDTAVFLLFIYDTCGSQSVNQYFRHR